MLISFNPKFRGPVPSNSNSMLYHYYHSHQCYLLVVRVKLNIILYKSAFIFVFIVVNIRSYCLPCSTCTFKMRLDVYKQSPAMTNISNNPITSPARSTLQGIANRDVPIIVFHIAKLKKQNVFLNFFIIKYK